jgi:hypothetical protein
MAHTQTKFRGKRAIAAVFILSLIPSGAFAHHTDCTTGGSPASTTPSTDCPEFTPETTAAAVSPYVDVPSQAYVRYAQADHESAAYDVTYFFPMGWQFRPENVKPAQNALGAPAAACADAFDGSNPKSPARTEILSIGEQMKVKYGTARTPGAYQAASGRGLLTFLNWNPATSVANLCLDLYTTAGVDTTAKEFLLPVELTRLSSDPVYGWSVHVDLRPIIRNQWAYDNAMSVVSNEIFFDATTGGNWNRNSVTNKLERTEFSRTPVQAESSAFGATFNVCREGLNNPSSSAQTCHDGNGDATDDIYTLTQQIPVNITTPASEGTRDFARLLTVGTSLAGGCAPGCPGFQPSSFGLVNGGGNPVPVKWTPPYADPLPRSSVTDKIDDGTTLTLGAPDIKGVGDAMILVVRAVKGSTLTAPSGFTLIKDTVGNVNHVSTFSHAVAASEPATYAITQSKAGPMSATLLDAAFVGSPIVNVNTEQVNATPSADIATKSISPTVPGTLLLSVVANDDADLTPVAPAAGYREQGDAPGLEVSYRRQNEALPAAPTSTFASGAHASLSQLLALTPSKPWVPHTPVKGYALTIGAPGDQDSRHFEYFVTQKILVDASNQPTGATDPSFPSDAAHQVCGPDGLASTCQFNVPFPLSGIGHIDPADGKYNAVLATIYSDGYRTDSDEFGERLCDNGTAAGSVCDPHHPAIKVTAPGAAFQQFLILAERWPLIYSSSAPRYLLLLDYARKEAAVVFWNANQAACLGSAQLGTTTPLGWICTIPAVALKDYPASFYRGSSVLIQGSNSPGGTASIGSFKPDGSAQSWEFNGVTLNSSAYGIITIFDPHNWTLGELTGTPTAPLKGTCIGITVPTCQPTAYQTLFNGSLISA